MTRELFGMLLGWVIVTVSAWFVALLLMGYTLANILPWTWTMEQRGIHLALQAGLILAYAILTRPRGKSGE